MAISESTPPRSPARCSEWNRAAESGEGYCLLEVKNALLPKGVCGLFAKTCSKQIPRGSGAPEFSPGWTSELPGLSIRSGRSKRRPLGVPAGARTSTPVGCHSNSAVLPRRIPRRSPCRSGGIFNGAKESQGGRAWIHKNPNRPEQRERCARARPWGVPRSGEMQGLPGKVFRGLVRDLMLLRGWPWFRFYRPTILPQGEERVSRK